jgi:Ca2+/Na+ antiporter
VLVGDHYFKIAILTVCVVIIVAMVMQLRNSEPYGIVFMNVCVVITDAMVTMLRDFGPYGVIFTIICIYYFVFSRHS